MYKGFLQYCMSRNAKSRGLILQKIIISTVDIFSGYLMVQIEEKDTARCHQTQNKLIKKLE